MLPRLLPREAQAMDDNSLLWTLFALIVVNTVVVVLAYVSAIRESKNRFEIARIVPLRQRGAFTLALRNE
jgi:bacteriorhodopsin